MSETVYRRSSIFGKTILFNNSALGGEIGNINIDAEKNTITFNPTFGEVYFKNIQQVYFENNLYLENTPSLTIDNTPFSSVSVGTIVMYPSSIAPNGWLICSGQTVSKSTYGLLYSYLGDTYGSTVNTFNLPNLIDRNVVHYDPSYTDYNIIGKTGGVNEVTLNANQLPNHSISGTTDNHSFSHYHQYNATSRYENTKDGSPYPEYRDMNGITNPSFDYQNGIAYHTHSVSSTANIYSSPGVLVTQTSINIVHPSQTIYYIIKH